MKVVEVSGLLALLHLMADLGCLHLKALCLDVVDSHQDLSKLRDLLRLLSSHFLCMVFKLFLLVVDLFKNGL